MFRIAIAAAIALALAGCGPSDSRRNSGMVNDAATSPEGVATLNKVIAMSDKERNIVLVRAVMDANMPCDGVVSSERTKDQDGHPAWLANCRNGSTHMVIFLNDGSAKVLSPVAH